MLYLESRKGRLRAAFPLHDKAPGVDSIEIYGVWVDDYACPPLVREEIHLDLLLDPDFALKERGFYCVKMRVRSG